MPQLLTSYIRIVHLLQLMNQYWCYYQQKSRVHSEFLSFFPNVLFLFQNPIQDSTLRLAVMSPWLWQFLNLSLFVRTIWGVLVRHFVGCSSTEMCVVFLIINIRLWVLGRTTTEAKCPFLHIIPMVHTVNMTYYCLCLGAPFFLSISGTLFQIPR